MSSFFLQNFIIVSLGFTPNWCVRQDIPVGSQLKLGGKKLETSLYRVFQMCFHVLSVTDRQTERPLVLMTRAKSVVNWVLNPIIFYSYVPEPAHQLAHKNRL